MNLNFFFFFSSVLLHICFPGGISRSEQNTRQKTYRLTLLIGTYLSVWNHCMLQKGDAVGVRLLFRLGSKVLKDLLLCS